MCVRFIIIHKNFLAELFLLSSKFEGQCAITSNENKLLPEDSGSGILWIQHITGPEYFVFRMLIKRGPDGLG